MNSKIADLRVKIFADGADLKTIRRMALEPFICGLTTNPTLMRKAGVTDYKKFAIEALEIIDNKPISFEVFSDDIDEMYNQAREISKWGKNVNVKIPVTNTKGESTHQVIRQLLEENIKVNVTALFTLDQVRQVVEATSHDAHFYISVFAGRIADTGVDPLPVMKETLLVMADRPNAELIWASPRELLNVIQANEIGCHIITATSDILIKLNSIGKNLSEFSLETVRMFYEDARSSGYRI